MNIIPFGDSAVLINFEQRIDHSINEQVVQLMHHLEAATIEGIRFFTPAYCSLTIGFDPLVIKFDLLKEKIIDQLLSLKPGLGGSSSRVLNLPVCYETEFAPDLSEVEQMTGLNKEEIINLHTGTSFRVYMLGFLPGFVYLGRLPKEIFVSRKTTPRLRVPALSVGLAGFQTGIYPFEAPGGWQLIGRTPIKIFDASRDNPFLFQTGDEVKFHAVNTFDYERILAEIENNSFHPESLFE